MPEKRNTIILCAGSGNPLSLPHQAPVSVSMTPVNGKSVIAWILDQLIEQSIRDIILVLREDDLQLSEFVSFCYAEKLNLKLAPLSKSISILDSCLAGLQKSDLSRPTQIILGDTLIKDAPLFGSDAVYIQEVKDSARWCLVDHDEHGIINKFIEKDPTYSGKCLALCGHYFISNAEAFSVAVQEAMDAGETELSQAFIRYPKALMAVESKQWYDFGNIDKYYLSKKSLLQSRYFNKLNINPTLNTITKFSVNGDKLNDELNWNLSLPDDLKVLAPRVITSDLNDKGFSLTTEYYGYPALSEYFLFGKLSLDQWNSIFEYLFDILRLFKNYSAPADKESLHYIYSVKPFERITQAIEKADDPELKSLLTRETININGVEFPGILSNMENMKEPWSILEDIDEFQIMHGDFCLSNILFDFHNQIIRLIDPKGNFKEKGIYGDARYDIAKLRHSVSGLYDYITSELFRLEYNDRSISFEFFPISGQVDISELLDQFIVDAGYDLAEIKLIESSLFVSMIPLHQENVSRQVMMLARAVQLCQESLSVTQNSRAI